MSAAVILNGDQIYVEELVQENAKLTVLVDSERRHRNPWVWGIKFERISREGAFENA